MQRSAVARDRHLTCTKSPHLSHVISSLAADLCGTNSRQLLHTRSLPRNQRACWADDTDAGGAATGGKSTPALLDEDEDEDEEEDDDDTGNEDEADEALVDVATDAAPPLAAPPALFTADDALELPVLSAVERSAAAAANTCGASRA